MNPHIDFSSGFLVLNYVWLSTGQAPRIIWFFQWILNIGPYIVLCHINAVSILLRGNTDQFSSPSLNTEMFDKSTLTWFSDMENASLWYAFNKCFCNASCNENMNRCYMHANSICKVNIPFLKYNLLDWLEDYFFSLLKNKSNFYQNGEKMPRYFSKLYQRIHEQCRHVPVKTLQRLLVILFCFTAPYKVWGSSLNIVVRRKIFPPEKCATWINNVCQQSCLNILGKEKEPREFKWGGIISYLPWTWGAAKYTAPK